MSIAIRNGRSVRLSSLHQCETYAGLLAGMPNESLNQSLMDSAVKDANKTLFGSDGAIKVTLVQPNIVVQEVNLGEERQISYPCLPGYITTVQLEDMDRCAVVVLFTNGIADLKEINEAVKDLDWQEISQDFSW